jgi:hypothetical protein
MKIAELQALEILMRLPDDTALLTEEAAVVLRTSVRQLERMRSPDSLVKGPKYQKAVGDGAKGRNQKVTYLIRDLKEWRKEQTIGGSHEAALKAGRYFVTLMDIAEEKAFWRNPEGKIAGLVDETGIDMFIARLGKWSIEWMAATDAVGEDWQSLASQKALASDIKDILGRETGRLNAFNEQAEMRAVMPPAKHTGGGGKGP